MSKNFKNVESITLNVVPQEERKGCVEVAFIHAGWSSII